MILRKAWALCALSFLLGSSGIVKAGTLTTVDDIVAADLANALTTGGAGGITITSESLSDNHFESIHNNKVENITSSGVFSTMGTNNFGYREAVSSSAPATPPRMAQLDRTFTK